MKNTIKKIAPLLLALILAFSTILVLPQNSAKAAAPKVGDKKVEYFYVSAADLKGTGGSISAGSTIIKSLKSKYKSHPYVLAGGAFLFLTGQYATLTGYKGYKVTLTYRYTKEKVFDGAYWVNYTGWGVPAWSISRYK